MPPCQKVLLNKIKRTNTIVRMIKSADKNFIEVPKPVDGYCLDGSKNFEIEYFPGHAYPGDIAELMKDSQIDNNNSTENDENEIELNLCSSDEEFEESDENE